MRAQPGGKTLWGPTVKLATIKLEWTQRQGKKRSLNPLVRTAVGGDVRGRRKVARTKVTWNKWAHKREGGSFPKLLVFVTNIKWFLFVERMVREKNSVSISISVTLVLLGLSFLDGSRLRRSTHNDVSQVSARLTVAAMRKWNCKSVSGSTWHNI